jgi:hypothetical protein
MKALMTVQITIEIPQETDVSYYGLCLPPSLYICDEHGQAVPEAKMLDYSVVSTEAL